MDASRVSGCVCVSVDAIDGAPCYWFSVLKICCDGLEAVTHVTRGSVVPCVHPKKIVVGLCWPKVTKHKRHKTDTIEQDFSFSFR